MPSGSQVRGRLRAGDQDADLGHARLAQAREQRVAAHVGQQQIDDRQRERPLLRERGFGAAYGHHIGAAHAERGRDHLAQAEVVVDDQDALVRVGSA